MSEFLNTKQACHYLGIKAPTLYKLTQNMEIPFYKPNGKMIYFDKNELYEYITRHHFGKDL